MQNAVSILLVLSGLISFVSAVVTIVALHYAPEGCEDEKGFSFVHDEEGYEFRLAAEKTIDSHLPEHAQAA